MAREVEGEKDNYTDQEKAKAAELKDLVSSAINKYSAQTLRKLMKIPEICLVYCCFYDFYTEDTSKSLLPITIKTDKQQLALKSADQAIHRSIRWEEK